MLLKNQKKIETVEDLFLLKYPEVFDIIKLSELETMSDRVLIIVDGLDELQNVYDFNTEMSFNLNVLSSLIDTKNGILKNHKVSVCGRPKACEFVKQQFSKNKSRIIEVVGFNQEDILKSIE